MNPVSIISALRANRTVFDAMLHEVPTSLRTWRPGVEHWCLLEIVCHLRDEEREDFRARLRSVLDDPTAPLPRIDPQGWVASRNYLEQDFEGAVGEFLAERDASIRWLEGLLQAAWENTHQHPKFGPMSAQLFLGNWLAHDYLHMRQITKRKYEFLKANAAVPLDYAGTW